MNFHLVKLVSIAGIFHDIGKFAERAGDVSTVSKEMVHQEYRYGHACHTERVLESLFSGRASWSPRSFPGINVLNLAARHHRPRNSYELLIAEGDRIASGHERMKADEAADYDVGGTDRKSKVPLINILARVRLEDKADPFLCEDWRYRLRTVSSIFVPGKLSEIYPCQGSEYDATMVKSDYQKHWAAFKNTLTRRHDGRQLDLFENLETIFEVCRNYMWCLPASTRKEELPDVSLFEHSKVTAALASCLYLYHANGEGRIEDTDKAKSEITDRSAKKFLLFAGDISGIQKFVYQISSKGAYRTLKGRSFFIQLLSEILARHFAEEFNLTLANLLYASGGKFYLLLPNTPIVKSRLSDLNYRLNEWLFKKFGGDLYVRTAFEALSGEDLTRQKGETLYDRWDHLTRKLVYSDRQRYQDLAASEYENLFGTENIKPGTCEVCHSSIDGGNRCYTCEEMSRMGKLLGEASYIGISTNKHEIPERPIFTLDKVFKEDTCIWFFTRDNFPSSVKSKLLILCINGGTISEIPLSFPYPERVNGGLIILGSNHKFDRTFDDIAKRSEGIQRLGILRMDVDDLGKIFSQGLKRYRHENFSDHRFYSLGRITTLSFQLNLFFGAIVPQLINEEEPLSGKVTVVYSGGDDLFLLGAWDVIPFMALKIRREFCRFTCYNECFGISGGIVVTGGKFPIYKSAEMAGEAEALAKNNEYLLSDGHPRRKNSLTFLDIPMSWGEFEEIHEIFQEMLSIFLNKKFNPLLIRLRQISHLFEKEKTMLRTKNIYTVREFEKKLMAEKWRWRMVYSLKRFAYRYKELEAEVERIRTFAVGQMKTTRKSGIELLPLLTRWWELRARGEKKEGGV